MEWTSENRYGKCSATINGELTIYVAGELKSRLLQLLAGDGDLEVVLAGVQEFDSAGVQLLLWLKRESEHRKKALRFTEPSQAVSDLVSLYGLGSDLGFQPDGGTLGRPALG